MEMQDVIQKIRGDLESIALLGDPAVADATRRLLAVFDNVLITRCLEMAGQLAAEVSDQLPDSRVEMRWTGQSMTFVVVDDQTVEHAEPAMDSDGWARVTLRLPTALKQAVEAEAGRDGASTNAWIVGLLQQAVARRRRTGHRLHGYGQA
jgi:predicted HicB family RNase H-like nuclease